MAHAKGTEHHNSKLNEYIVKRVRELHSTGEYTLVELAGIFGIAISQVHKIVTHKQWKHVS